MLPSNLQYSSPDSFAHFPSLFIFGLRNINEYGTLKQMISPAQFNSLYFITPNGKFYNDQQVNYPTYANHFSIPTENRSLKAQALHDCRFINHLRVLDHIDKLDVNAFAWNEQLTSVTLLKNSSHIPHGVFNGCTRLQRIIIHNHVSSIGVCAFYKYDQLTSICTPKSVTKMDELVFPHYPEPIDIHLHSIKKTIARNAFYKSKSIRILALNNHHVKHLQRQLARCSKSKVSCYVKQHH